MLLLKRFNLKNICRVSSCNISYSKTVKMRENLKSLLDNAASFKDVDPENDKWITGVYHSNKGRKQSEHSFRPLVDPKTTSIILFPGQGSQYVGMAKSLVDYPNVVEIFECASSILRYNLLDLCINGPSDMLNMTVHSQVAVVVSSLAAIEKLKVENPKVIENCVATAGFSVGEFSALVFAGGLEFETAVKLLKIRGEAMQAASNMKPSGMMTVFQNPGCKIKQACAAAREWCQQQNIEDPECRIAIYLFPECKVISGHMEALKYLELNAAKFDIKKLKYIPVSGAFHSKLMLPAKNVLLNALKASKIEIPLIPVHSNVDGKIYKSVEDIQTKLAQQVCSPVAWEQTMHIIYERTKSEGFPETYECGPGTTLKTVLRLNNNEAYKSCYSVQA